MIGREVLSSIKFPLGGGGRWSQEEGRGGRGSHGLGKRGKGSQGGERTDRGGGVTDKRYGERIGWRERESTKLRAEEKGFGRGRKVKGGGLKMGRGLLYV